MIHRLQKALSEFTGTFALVFFGTGAVVVNTAYTAAGLQPIGHLGISLTFGSIVALMERDSSPWIAVQNQTLLCIAHDS